MSQALKTEPVRTQGKDPTGQDQGRMLGDGWALQVHSYFFNSSLSSPLSTVITSLISLGKVTCLATPNNNSYEVTEITAYFTISRLPWGKIRLMGNCFRLVELQYLFKTL